jgi:RND family efflux transporter MFP subunit
MQRTLTLTVTALTLLISSCSNPDKQAHLDELKTQKTALEAEIAALEAELGTSSTTASGKITDVLVDSIRTASFTHYIDVQGVVEASEAVDLRPAMAGIVTKINVKEGDNVQKGQVLAETDNEIYVRQLNSLEPQLQLASELYDRQSRLWAQQIGSEVQLLQAKTQKEALEKQMRTLEEQIDMTRIKSPISGTVDYVGLKMGQLAAANFIEPAFRIVNLNSLKVVANMSESAAPLVRSGNTVKLQFPDLGEETESKITFTSRTIDPITRTFAAHASLANNAAYRPNMVVVMRIVDYENPSAIAVPINLIQSGLNESFVYVATTREDGKRIAARRVVSAGKSYGSVMEITGGLLEGDLLITTGYSQLTDGAEITF